MSSSLSASINDHVLASGEIVGLARQIPLGSF
jgi:hypothetical protein